MSLYNELVAVDIITPILGTFKVGFLSSGAPVVRLENSYKQTPWIHHRVYSGRQCGVWHIYFQNYNIIPKGCRNCWKVVMEIPTLTQLMRVKEHQDTSKWNCKCGLETRPMTGGLGGYRGFWYAPMDEGLAGGRAMLADVQRDFPGVRLTLKRGCTEFETQYSPSDIWGKLAKDLAWDEKEKLLNEFFVVEKVDTGKGTPVMIQPSVLRKWIEFGYEHSVTTKDNSYTEFIHGTPVPPVLTYQSGRHSDEEFAADEYPLPREREENISYGEVVNFNRGESKDKTRSSGNEIAVIGEMEA